MTPELAEHVLRGLKNVLGVPVLYEREGVQEILTGIQSNPGQVRVLSSGVAVEVREPSLLLVVSDLAANFSGEARRNDEWTYLGRRYRVAQVEPDGMGGVFLTGEEQR